MKESSKLGVHRAKGRFRETPYAVSIGLLIIGTAPLVNGLTGGMPPMALAGVGIYGVSALSVFLHSQIDIRINRQSASYQDERSKYA